jgi:SAM-dependent methyltransferase
MLTAFAELVTGPVADVGCGSGRVTAFLHDLGVPTSGIDLSPRMVAAARRTYPALRFIEGVHRTKSRGHQVKLDFHRRRSERMAEFLHAAGLTVQATLLREPDDEGDYPEDTPQAYVLARRP